MASVEILKWINIYYWHRKVLKINFVENVVHAVLEVPNKEQLYGKKYPSVKVHLVIISIKPKFYSVMPVVVTTET